MQNFIEYLKENCGKSNLSKMKKVNRAARLAHEYLHGTPKSKVFGGKPSIKKDRRSSKKELRDQR